MKHLLIGIIDAFDCYIFRHRSYWLCSWIARSEWWDESKMYECPDCNINVIDNIFGHDCGGKYSKSCE